jgi:hypothetical protein
MCALLVFPNLPSHCYKIVIANIFHLTFLLSLGTSVGIATGYGLDGSGIESR